MSQPTQSMTEDQQYLENAKKFEQKKKKDERIVDKVEFLDEKVSRINNKEQTELQKLDSTKAYYRRIRLSAERRLETEVAALEARIDKINKRAEIEVTALEARIEKVKQNIQDSITYADQMLEKVDVREEVFKNSISKQVKKTESKKETLVNKIVTPSLKKQAIALLEKKPEPEPEPESEPEQKTESESESEAEEEAAPPPKPIKMTPKQPGVQQQPKIISNTKRERKLDAVEEAAKAEEAEAKSKEAVMRELNTKIGVEKNILGVLERQVKPNPEAIFQKKMEIEMLQHKYNTLKSQIPSYLRR